MLIEDCKTMATMTATKALVVPLGDECVKICQGEKVDIESLPADAVDAMTRLGQLVLDDEYLPAPEPEPENDSDESKDGHESESQFDVAADQIGLPDDIVAILIENGLLTIADILRYGSENETLTKIKGIGDASEKKIQEAITAASV